MNKNKEPAREDAHEDAGIKSSTAKDLALPLRILISPLKTFKQLAANPTAKGLILLAALIVVVSAAAQYVSATRIVLTIGESQFVDFVATGNFMNWFLGTSSANAFTIAIYWLTAAASLALISRFSFRGGKVFSLRVTLTILGYLLSVFVVLYALRVAIYLTLPPIRFPSSTWPPTDPTDIDLAMNLMSQNWTPLPAFQLGTILAIAAFVWLTLLGTAAIKAMHEISWFKAGLISVTGFVLTLTLFGLP